jgi:hypothetical protein
MKIGRTMLTFATLAALSVGGTFAQSTVSKPMASKMAEEQTTPPQSGQKKVGNHVHGHHHKNKKHTSKTSAQESTTKK